LGVDVLVLRLGWRPTPEPVWFGDRMAHPWVRFEIIPFAMGVQPIGKGEAGR
jgi:hypothetical protein